VEPARLGERVRVGRGAVPRGQGRSADHDAALARLGAVVQPDSHSVERHPVVDAATGGLTGTVGAHHGDPGRRRTLEHRPRRRAATEQYGIEFGQRRGGLWIQQGFGQLGRHE
jgi:hypothetical protein